MRIVFCGTPEFSVEPLKQLLAQKFNVVGVYCQPDKGVGRGRKIQYSAVKQCAIDNNIDVYQPKSLRNQDDIETLKALNPDLLVVVAYGLILPQAVLDIPSIACWNIHASLLPRWRGAAPIHRALLAGDKSTGVGIMHMEAGLDTGAVYLQHECAISHNETAQRLYDRLAKMGSYALIECLDLLNNDLLPQPMPQDNENVTYAHKLEKSESKIAWDENAEQIDRKIRAFNPWPGVVGNIEGNDYKLWQSTVINEQSQLKPGEIVMANKNTLVIACKKGQLQIKAIQKPGKKQMQIEQFMPSMRQWYK